MKTIENDSYFASVNARIQYADRKGGTHENKLASIISFDSYSRYVGDDGSLLEADIEQAKLYANQSRDRVFKIFNKKLHEAAECLVAAKDRETMINTLKSLNSAYKGALEKIGNGITLSDKTSQIVNDIIHTGGTSADDDSIRESLKDYYTVLISLTAHDVFENTEEFELAAAACINLSHAEIYPKAVCVHSAESASELTVSHKFCSEVTSSIIKNAVRKNYIDELVLEIAVFAIALTFSIGGFISGTIIPGLFGAAFAVSELKDIDVILHKMYPQGLKDSHAALKIRDSIDALKYRINKLNSMEEDELDMYYYNSEFDNDIIFDY